jgi:hypothetical protein
MKVFYNIKFQADPIIFFRPPDSFKSQEATSINTVANLNSLFHAPPRNTYFLKIFSVNPLEII